MSTTPEGVALKNGGAGSTRGAKGRMTAMTRGRFGFDFSVSIQDPASPNGVRVLYMDRQDADDLADCLDAVLEATERDYAQP